MAEDRQLLLAVSTAILIIIGGWLVNSSLQKRKYRLPPQVPGLPIFGNTFQIPSVQQGPWAKQFAEKYGEMFVTNAQSTSTPPSSKSVSASEILWSMESCVHYTDAGSLGSLVNLGVAHGFFSIPPELSQL